MGTRYVFPEPRQPRFPGHFGEIDIHCLGVEQEINRRALELRLQLAEATPADPESASRLSWLRRLAGGLRIRSLVSAPIRQG